MKKFIYLVAAFFAFNMNMNAQVVISNDYDSPIQGTNDQKVPDDEVETLSYIGLSFYSFDGFNNWGFNSAGLNWNGIGYEFALRSQLKFNDYDNLNFDFGVNYSFGLWKDNDKELLLTLAAGPSIRNQKEIDFSSSKTKDKIFFDAYFNPRVTFAVGKFTISGGYFFWAPKFKFGSDYKIDGFNAIVGWNL